MSDAQQVSKTYSNAAYVPPDARTIKAFVLQVCAKRDLGNDHYTHQEVVTGLTSFLNFMACTSARYMSKGHQRYLLKGYKQARQFQKGG